MASSAESLFERAKRALASGDFQAAVKHAQEAESAIYAHVHISDHGAPPNPPYSIIVVLYQRHADLGQALSRLSRYSDQQEFELIFVNNGDFVAQEILSQNCKQFRWIDVGFNYGCSGGRNLGARAARGGFLIFVDDDGFIEEYAIEHLIDAITKHDALAVRGRVYPKDQLGVIVPHYDLGDDVIYSVPNTEGISVWRRQEFIDDGGFDTLLAGGEGLALWSKMCHSHGPNGFLYTPHAILRHDFAKNTEHFKRKTAKGSPNEAYFLFAYPDVQRQRWEATLKLTLDAVERDPENAGLHYHLGNLLQRLGRLDEAEAAHRRAIELKPDLAGAHRQLSSIFAQHDRQDEALAAARRAVECDPENAELHYYLGNLLQKWKRLAEAEAAHRRAIELKPNFGRALLKLSVIFAKQDRMDEALTAARRAVECDPENAGLHYHLGKLLQRLGRLDEAEAAHRRAHLAEEKRLRLP
jgi:tetratricopeptide (TPR) repeat protein